MFCNILKQNFLKIPYVQNICQTCCYCARPVKEINTNLLTFFEQHFDLRENEVKKLFKKYPSFYRDTYSTLSNQLSYLMNVGLSKDDILKKIQILTLHPVTTRNYVMLLEEGGFIKSKIDANTLLKYKWISKRSIISLKEDHYIHKDVDVQHNILSFIEFPSQLYSKKCDDLLPWNVAVGNMFKLYIEWKIKMDLNNFKSVQSIYHRLQNKSFRLVEKSIDILLNELNFSEEKIRRHPYLIHSDPYNTQYILKNIEHLCGKDTKQTLENRPKIILTSWETIVQIQNHLKTFGIPESATSKAPEIYTLGSNTIQKRLSKIKETPELASFINNPQIARVVYYFRKVNLRLKYLQNKNCVSLNLLVTNESSFNRFNFNGNDKGKTNDIMVFLVEKLGKDKFELRTLLERHPYWHYISLLTIRTNYEFLKKKKFTNEQMCHCPHILLYPIDKIKEGLNAVQNVKKVSFLRDTSGAIKPEYMLSLLLYNLEKDHHFSGGGVWNTNEMTDKIITPNSLKATSEDTEELDHEPSTKLMV